jgi:hypothetical protein|tara:strand:- start:13039 stop:13776 length:738 start_codon:yes stop_codon:yes gene_type:complete
MANKLTKKKIIPLFIFVAIASVGVGSFIHFNENEVDNSKLERLMQSSQVATDVTVSIDREPAKKVNVTSSKPKDIASEDDIRFVVSRDFNAVAACASMLTNSLNKEVQAQWLQQRLNVNAQRERTRLANLNLEEQEASFKALQLQKKEEALHNAKVDSFNFGSFLKGESGSEQLPIPTSVKWPVIILQSISESQKATFSIDGQLFIDRQEGDYFESYQLSKVEYGSGCISFVGNDVSTQFKRICM